MVERGHEEGGMKYLLAIYGDSSTWGTQSEEEANAELDAFAAFERAATEAGVLVGGEALDPEAYTVSVREGRPVVTDGALTEPDQRLGCFYLVECGSVAEAKDWAPKVPLVGDGGFQRVGRAPAPT
jgi:hypothetical protein